MRSPECKEPMSQARHEGGVRVFVCPRCKRTKRGVTQGQITLSDKVPVRLQEKG